ncbi:MAG: TIGR04282 family arsenosugar biosynthesis glycosyltransferase [Ferruginibacter sp.]
MTLLKKALIIFARKPELGKVKTRLAATAGAEAALAVYEKLLVHTRMVAKETGIDTYVFLTEPTDDHFWEDFYCELQVGDTLGDRMQQAFHFLFLKKYNECVMIGSDCPGLSTEIINGAFDDLQKNDVVIGPATDGGYYLLGMKEPSPVLFQNINWSTEKVFSQTIQAIKLQKLSYAEGVTLNDVDEEKDVPFGWL